MESQQSYRLCTPAEERAARARVLRIKRARLGHEVKLAWVVLWDHAERGRDGRRLVCASPGWLAERTGGSPARALTWLRKLEAIGLVRLVDAEDERYELIDPARLPRFRTVAGDGQGLLGFAAEDLDEETEAGTEEEDTISMAAQVGLAAPGGGNWGSTARREPPRDDAEPQDESTRGTSRDSSGQRESLDRSSGPFFSPAPTVHPSSVVHRRFTGEPPSADERSPSADEPPMNERSRVIDRKFLEAEAALAQTIAAKRRELEGYGEPDAARPLRTLTLTSQREIQETLTSTSATSVPMAPAAHARDPDPPAMAGTWRGLVDPEGERQRAVEMRENIERIVGEIRDAALVAAVIEAVQDGRLKRSALDSALGSVCKNRPADRFGYFVRAISNQAREHGVRLPALQQRGKPR